MPTDRFIRDKAAIRAELERRARARRVITYGEVAVLVGRSAAALMPVLAAIRAEDARRGRPDLTCLVVSVRTGLPRGMDRDRAVVEQEGVFAAYTIVLTG